MPRCAKQVLAAIDELERLVSTTRRAVQRAKSLKRLIRTSTSQSTAPGVTLDHNVASNERQLPTSQGDSALIRIIACGLCTSVPVHPTLAQNIAAPIEIRVTRMSVTSTEPLICTTTTVWA
ncbi:hypothetical protein CYLTODRAFT_442686 [Cylindrobasidium torrendii FP15055 ss-10]|uniref:Uncharacterized protein n=1 Tax=Cylindrobasidium torrendii FP15055 ss-10 TaxID=1314674 RepID=A0A0D7BGY2_9AGAR|nr:hypothetical protein CYLTODRAFT_442686 [Cylindrobasidium torrendii FP15055 ss-10]